MVSGRTVCVLDGTRRIHVYAHFASEEWPMSNWIVTVYQDLEYHVIELDLNPAAMDMSFGFVTVEYFGIARLELLTQPLNEIYNDIIENFSISDMIVNNKVPSIHLSCALSELRKIETWLSLGDYQVKSLVQGINTLHNDT
jgi:hypothetical protein